MIEAVVIVLAVFVAWWAFWLVCGTVMAIVRGLGKAWRDD